MKDIECPPLHQPPTECLRGSWRVWGIEEEERGMTAGKNCSKDDENLVKLTDPCRYSWLKKKTTEKQKPHQPFPLNCSVSKEKLLISL